jgi:hypothetical protein
MFDDNNGGKALHSVNITRVSLDKVGGDRWIRYSRDSGALCGWGCGDTPPP